MDLNADFSFTAIHGFEAIYCNLWLHTRTVTHYVRGSGKVIWGLNLQSWLAIIYLWFIMWQHQLISNFAFCWIPKVTF